MSKPPTLGTLVNEATRAALSNPEVAANLSPQSILISQVATTAISGATGAATPSEVARALTEVAISQMATALMTSGIRSLADAVPIVQQVVAIVGMIVDWVTSANEEGEARSEAYKQTVLQAEKFFAVVGTVPGGKCPADVFAPYDADDAVRLGGTFFLNSNAAGGSFVQMGSKVPASEGVSRSYRPILGQVLIRSTEGGSEGQTHFSYEDKWLDYDTWTSKLRAAYPSLKKLVGAKVEWMQHAGVPKGRRDVYRLLRLAMQAQRKYQPKGSANGGVSLWPIYMDMLHHDFSKGRLSAELCAASGFSTFYATGRVVEDLVHQWELRINPWYTEGQDAQVRAQEEALALAETMGPANRLTALAIAISSSPRPKRPRLKLDFE